MDAKLSPCLFVFSRCRRRCRVQPLAFRHRFRGPWSWTNSHYFGKDLIAQELEGLIDLLKTF